MTVDVTTMVRKLYKDFYGGGRSPAVDIPDVEQVQVDDIRLFADSQQAEKILKHLSSKKWSIKDKQHGLFKIHDSPHNYNVQIRAHKGKEINDDTVLANKNISKLAKYLLSGTGKIVLPVLNIETDKLPQSITNKLNALNVTLPKGSSYSLEFTERFFKTETLGQYMKKGNSPSEKKALLFNLLNSLRICRQNVPNFTHNNLNKTNVIVYRLNPSKNGSLEHKVNLGNDTYQVPTYGTELRLSGFDKAGISKNGNSIKKDVVAVAKIFEREGANPEGASAFFRRLKNASSYDEILNDSFFDEFKDSVTYLGGSDEDDSDSDSDSEEKANMKLSKDDDDDDDTREEDDKKKKDDSSSSEDDSEDDEDDKSTTLGGASDTISSFMPSKSSKKDKQRRRRGSKRHNHAQVQQQQYNPIYSALNATEFFRNPSASISAAPQQFGDSMIPDQQLLSMSQQAQSQMMVNPMYPEQQSMMMPDQAQMQMQHPGMMPEMQMQQPGMMPEMQMQQPGMMPDQSPIQMEMQQPIQQSFPTKEYLQYQQNIPDITSMYMTQTGGDVERPNKEDFFF
jgi:hypothetical protein